jgi:hypothetical protein
MIPEKAFVCNGEKDHCISRFMQVYLCSEISSSKGRGRSTFYKREIGFLKEKIKDNNL